MLACCAFYPSRVYVANHENIESQGKILAVFAFAFLLFDWKKEEIYICLSKFSIHHPPGCPDGFSEVALELSICDFGRTSTPFLGSFLRFPMFLKPCETFENTFFFLLFSFAHASRSAQPPHVGTRPPLEVHDPVVRNKQVVAFANGRMSDLGVVQHIHRHLAELMC